MKAKKKTKRPASSANRRATGKRKTKSTKHEKQAAIVQGLVKALFDAIGSIDAKLDMMVHQLKRLAELAQDDYEVEGNRVPHEPSSSISVGTPHGD